MFRVSKIYSLIFLSQNVAQISAKHILYCTREVSKCLTLSALAMWKNLQALQRTVPMSHFQRWGADNMRGCVFCYGEVRIIKGGTLAVSNMGQGCHRWPPLGGFGTDIKHPYFPLWCVISCDNRISRHFFVKSKEIIYAIIST